jgi:hypothetical protein
MDHTCVFPVAPLLCVIVPNVAGPLHGPYVLSPAVQSLPADALPAWHVYELHLTVPGGIPQPDAPVPTNK